MRALASSQTRPDSVNEDPDRGRELRAQARSLRRLIEHCERPITIRQPAEPKAPTKPEGADQVLEQLGAKYRPGDPVGDREIVAATGIRLHAAAFIRRWAQHSGRWPYAKPLTGFEAMQAARRKGGEP